MPITIEPTITLAIIISLCAIMSPVFTTIINNRNNYKLKKLELEHDNNLKTEAYKRKLYENYFIYAGKCITHADPESLRQYGESYLMAFLYFQPTEWSLLRQIHKNITKYEWEEATHVLEELIRTIQNKDFLKK